MKSITAFIILTVLFGTAQGQKQGITGKVFWLSGNQMPGPGKSTSPQMGVPREIFVYKVTHVEETEQKEGFYIAIKTELVKTIFSSNDGTFKIKLPPGEYSVFVKEPNGFFANLIDRENKINPVVVKPKKFSWLTINIDYDAAY